MGGCLSKNADDLDPLNDSRRAPVLIEPKKDNGAAAPAGGDAKAAE
jgi:hypothetical protein